MPKVNDEIHEQLSTHQQVLDAEELKQFVEHRDHGHNDAIMFGFGVLLIVLALVSLCLGRFYVSPGDVLSSFGEFFNRLLSGQPLTFSEAIQSVVINLRLPRIIAAILIGAALAIAGASYQGVFRNPMVSSDILGASAGAGFGASIAILLGAPGVVVQVSAFVCGMLAVGITYTISKAVGSHDATTLVLVLAGIVVQALFQAFVGCAKYLADPYSQLPEITFWLMGSLSMVSFSDILLMLAPLVVGIAVLLVLRWRINVLSFGDEEAAALGVDTKRLRLAIIICATLVTGSAVSVAGQVGWIGLVVPHLARMIVGPNYRHLLPVSLLIGSCFLLIVDDVARNLMQAEIPLGILTAIIGAPVFVFLLLKGRRGWT